MEYFLVILFIVFLILAVLIQILSLPGNWLAVILVIIWKFIGPASSTLELSWTFILLLIALAAVGEAMEWLLQLKVGKKFGSSFKGNVGGIIGAIVGAILFLPLFFGFGALLGALVGAYLGCLAAELLQGREGKIARKAAWGAFLGKFLGLGLKLGLGATIIWLTIVRVWPTVAAAAESISV